MWRIVSHPRFDVSLIELETQWSMEDVFNAHVTADLIETADARAWDR